MINHNQIYRQSNIQITAHNPLTSGGKSANTDVKQYHFDYLSDHPGAGKTTYMINQAVKGYFKKGLSSMIVVPSRELVDQIGRDSNGIIIPIHGGQGKSIDQETYDGEKTSTRIFRIVNETYEDKGFPVAIVITEAAYLVCLTAFTSNPWKLKDWVCFKDEPNDPLVVYKYKCSPQAKKLIIDNGIDLANIDGKITKKLSLAKPINPDMIFTDTSCELTGELAKFRSFVNNPHIEVLLDNNALSKGTLKYSIFQLPSAYNMFAKVIFMKAFFEYSFIHNQWNKIGVNWNKIDTKLGKINTKRLRIFYFLDDESEYGFWSNNKREKIVNGKMMLHWFQDEIRKIMPDGNYVYAANNKYDNANDTSGYDEAKITLNGIRMPAVCHGLNHFRHHTNVVLIGSYKENTGNNPFYHHYGSSTHDAILSRETQFYVQQITRTDIRNYDSDKIINVYIPTIHEAKQLQPFFKGSHIINIKKPNEYRYLPDNFEFTINTDTVPTHDDAIFGKGADTSPRAQKEYGHCIQHLDFDAGTRQGLIDIIKEQKTMYNGTTINSKTKKLGHDYLLHILSLATKISNKGLTKGTEEYDFVKKGLWWVSVGIFNPGDALKDKNSQGSRMIAFDFDGTDLTDKEIEFLLSPWQYLQYSTFSDTGATDNRRFRCFIPYDKPVSVMEHKRIAKYFINIFKDYCTKNNKKWMIDVYDKAGNMRPECILDMAKTIKTEAKLFTPHNESTIIWKMTHKTNSKNIEAEPLNTYNILAESPRIPALELPSLHQFERGTYDDDTKTTGKPIVYQNSTISPKELEDLIDKHNLRFDTMKVCKEVKTYREYPIFIAGCQAIGMSYGEMLSLSRKVADSKGKKELDNALSSTKSWGTTPESFSGWIVNKLRKEGIYTSKSNNTPKKSTGMTGTKVVVEHINYDELTPEIIPSTSLEKTQILAKSVEGIDEYREKVAKMDVIYKQKKSHSALHDYIFNKNDDDDFFHVSH